MFIHVLKSAENELEVSRCKVCTLSSPHTHTLTSRPPQPPPSRHTPHTHPPTPPDPPDPPDPPTTTSHSHPSPTSPLQSPPQTMGTQREATTGGLTKIHRSTRASSYTHLLGDDRRSPVWPYSSTADMKCRLSNTSHPRATILEQGPEKLGACFTAWTSHCEQDPSSDVGMILGMRETVRCNAVALRSELSLSHAKLTQAPLEASLGNAEPIRRLVTRMRRDPVGLVTTGALEPLIASFSRCSMRRR